MVHHRGELDDRQVAEALEMVDHVVGRQFAPQMHLVIGPEPAVGLGHGDSAEQHVDVVAHARHLDVRADAQCVEHGGDAGTCDLRIVRLQCRHRVPVDAGARMVVVFEVVGVQFNQPRHQIVAAEVFPARGVGQVDGVDQPVLDGQRTLDHLVAEDDFGVLDHQVRLHHGSPING